MTATPLLFPFTRRLMGFLNVLLEDFHHTMGQVAGNTVLTLQYLVQGRVSLRQWIQQAAFIGVDALGIALILTLFSGMVIALQVATELTKQGAGDYVGAVVSVAILRELAPVMTGFAVIAMVGSAYAAEMATMTIQNQVDALEVFHVHPIRYLMLPRFCAAITMMPLITLLTAMAGIVGGMVISYTLADLNYNNFLESVWHQTQTKDLIGAMIKGGVFGGIIVLFSVTIGLSASGGAKDVGNATTRAVVWSLVAMAVADYVLTFLIFGGH